MLIDSRHKPWFLATAVLAVLALGVYLWFYTTTPGGLTGGSLVGMWYGIVGALLMIYAGLLSVLRRVPSWWWIGSRQTWLHGHIWLGSLSGLFILCHSGFRWGGPLELVLWVVVLLTLGSGVIGLLLQHFLPRIITTRITAEAPYEQIPHLCARLRGQADTLVESLRTNKTLNESARAELSKFYAEKVQPFLAGPYDPAASLTSPVQAELLFNGLRSLPGLAPVKEPLSTLEAYCDERRQLGEQQRLYHWLHGWLLLHVPLSLVLLVLGLAHVVMSLYY